MGFVLGCCLGRSPPARACINRGNLAGPLKRPRPRPWIRTWEKPPPPPPARAGCCSPPTALPPWFQAGGRGQGHERPSSPRSSNSHTPYAIGLNSPQIRRPWSPGGVLEPELNQVQIGASPLPWSLAGRRTSVSDLALGEPRGCFGSTWCPSSTSSTSVSSRCTTCHLPRREAPKT
jgi:hypothetical protein